jgi:catechol 2,3-dioxygenase-like lactoylglutathione lyase family enzyme
MATTTAAIPTMAKPDAPPSGLRGIHHLALNTDDMRKTVEFYCGVHTLVTAPGGAERAKTRGNPPFECIRHYFFDMGGDQLLAFFEFPKGTPVADRNTLATMQHLSFAVARERYDEILAGLKAAGVKIVDGPFMSVAPSTWSFYFFDPNGIRLEISTDKASAEPDALGVVRSCLQTREEVRRELATLTDDGAWIERMLDTMPQ